MLKYTPTSFLDLNNMLFLVTMTSVIYFREPFEWMRHFAIDRTHLEKDASIHLTCPPHQQEVELSVAIKYFF